MCKNPFVKGVMPYPCGQCLPCRLNRRRLWTHRLMLEARLHEFSSFWTLTYAPEFIPEGGSLQPLDTKLWLYRIRKVVGSGRPLRYYLVGEYGDETFRPHYHVALFGVSEMERELVLSTWRLGQVHGGSLTAQSAQYIAGYVTKKMVSKDDPRLKGRHPEFARMSLRPGIGAGAMKPVAAALNTSAGAEAIARDGDVPTTLKHERKSLPLGRYLRSKLREEMGFDSTGGQEKPQAEMVAEMRALQDATGSPALYKSLKPFIEHQKILQIEGKAKIWKKKGTL